MSETLFRIIIPFIPYGIDFLIKKKQEDLQNCGHGEMTDNIIRQREELADQMKALNQMKEMAAVYGYDISVPAVNASEAVQWLYFGYLAAIKTQNGAAMSVGRISTFLDIYIDDLLRDRPARAPEWSGVHRLCADAAGDRAGAAAGEEKRKRVRLILASAATV